MVEGTGGCVYSLVWNICRPDDVDFANKDHTSNDHGNGDDGQVDTGELDAPDVDMFPAEDISPEQTCQRGAESRAERTVVHTDRHGVNRCPPGSVANPVLGELWVGVDCCPCLNDSAEEDGGPDIGS